MNIALLPHVDPLWCEDGNPPGRPVLFTNFPGTDLRLWDAVQRYPGDKP